MADFCLRCAIDMGFGPHSDFAWLGEQGILTSSHTAAGFGVVMLCEGCGPTYVDHLGRCMGGCDEKHTPPEADEVLRKHAGWVARRSGPLGLLYRLRDRLLGTPWEPGLIHEVRWRWHSFMDRLRGRQADWPGWEFDLHGDNERLGDGSPLSEGGSQDPVHGGGASGDAQGGGDSVEHLRQSVPHQQLGASQGPGSAVRPGLLTQFVRLFWGR